MSTSVEGKHVFEEILSIFVPYGFQKSIERSILSAQKNQSESKHHRAPFFAEILNPGI